MTFADMKRNVYESYRSGDISKSTAYKLLNTMIAYEETNELDRSINEMEAAQSSFMEVAMNYSQNACSFHVFEAEGSNFMDKVKQAWEAFKKWVKSIADKIAEKFNSLRNKVGQLKSRFDLKKAEAISDTTVAAVSSSGDPDKIAEKLEAVDVPDTSETATESVSYYREDSSDDDDVYVYDASIGNRIVGKIKDNLLKISDALTRLEMNDGNNKIISVLRPIIAFLNHVVISVAAVATPGEKKAMSSVLDVDTNDLKSDNPKYDKVLTLIDEYDRKHAAIEDQIDNLTDRAAKITEDFNKFIFNDASSVKDVMNAQNKYFDELSKIQSEIDAVEKPLNPILEEALKYYNELKNSEDVSSTRFVKNIETLAKKIASQYEASYKAIMRNSISSTKRVFMNKNTSKEVATKAFNNLKANLDRWDMRKYTINDDSKNDLKKTYEIYKKQVDTIEAYGKQKGLL